jgi:hypothetical protein
MCIAAVRRQEALFDAAEAKLAARVAGEGAGNRPGGATRVFSFRIDVQELRALERRAVLLDVKPSVLARNFVRIGLGGHSTNEIATIVDRLENDLAELRALVP